MHASRALRICNRHGCAFVRRPVALVLAIWFVLVRCTPADKRETKPEARASATKVTTTTTTTTTAAPAIKPSALTQSVGDALPALQRARLEYLFEAMALVASQWSWPTGEETCVFLLAPAVQWVVNCDEAPSAGFSRLANDLRGRPVYMRSGGTFNAAGRALSTKQLLEIMPAAAHVDEAGVRNTDLPAGHPWLVLGSLEALVQYHPAFLTSSTEEWLSVAIHELFHARQMRLPSFATSLRSINTHRRDPKVLATLYTDDAKYRALVKREYALLVDAARRDRVAPSRAQKALRAWYGSYLERRSNLAARPNGAALTETDSLFTYLEGVARYVESTFLVEPTQHPSTAIPGDALFGGFARWEGRGYPAMPNRQLDDQYYYAIGFHLGLLLDRVDPTWKQRVHTHPDWLIGLVAAQSQ